MEIEVVSNEGEWLILKSVANERLICAYCTAGYGFGGIYRDGNIRMRNLPNGLDRLGVYTAFSKYLRENGYIKGATDEHSTDDPA